MFESMGVCFEEWWYEESENRKGKIDEVFISLEKIQGE